MSLDSRPKHPILAYFNKVVKQQESGFIYIYIYIWIIPYKMDQKSSHLTTSDCINCFVYDELDHFEVPRGASNYATFEIAPNF